MTTWVSTQFWFSVMVAALAQWSLVAGLISAEVWMASITAATVLFGGRKILEHRGNGTKPNGGA